MKYKIIIKEMKIKTKKKRGEEKIYKKEGDVGK